MIDLLTLATLFLDAISAFGLGYFLFLGAFSGYIRPFNREASYNFRHWTHGRYSVLTGELAPGVVPWGATPDGLKETVDAMTGWAHQ